MLITVLNPVDLPRIGIQDGEKVLIDEILVSRCCGDSSVKEGYVGSSNLQWSALHLTGKNAPGTNVTIESWDLSNQNTNNIANTISMYVIYYCFAFNTLLPQITNKRDILRTCLIFYTY